MKKYRLIYEPKEKKIRPEHYNQSRNDRAELYPPPPKGIERVK